MLEKGDSVGTAELFGWKKRAQEGLYCYNSKHENEDKVFGPGGTAC